MSKDKKDLIEQFRKEDEAIEGIEKAMRDVRIRAVNAPDFFKEEDAAIAAINQAAKQAYIDGQNAPDFLKQIEEEDSAKVKKKDEG